MGCLSHQFHVLMAARLKNSKSKTVIKGESIRTSPCNAHTLPADKNEIRTIVQRNTLTAHNIWKGHLCVTLLQWCWQWYCTNQHHQDGATVTRSSTLQPAQFQSTSQHTYTKDNYVTLDGIMFLFAVTYASNSENNMNNKNFINFFVSVLFQNSANS